MKNFVSIRYAVVRVCLRIERDKWSPERHVKAKCDLMGVHSACAQPKTYPY